VQADFAAQMLPRVLLQAGLYGASAAVLMFLFFMYPGGMAWWVLARSHPPLDPVRFNLHADMSHKQQAIDRTKPLAAKPGRYRPPDALLAFLEAL
jgi:hypothetical protein